jgi:hypothetical protein
MYSKYIFYIRHGYDLEYDLEYYLEYLNKSVLSYISNIYVLLETSDVKYKKEKEKNLRVLVYYLMILINK